MGYLENTLQCLFTPDVGLSEEAIAGALARIIANPDSRQLDGIKAELVALYRNRETDWIKLLENDVYEVYPAKDQSDGQDFVTTRLWNVFFPHCQDAPPSSE